MPTDDAYLEVISSLPKPTPQQTARFVAHVAGAHPWHELLPALPPGVPFVFFLNPDAGRRRLRTGGGEVAFVERRVGETPTSPSWMPTEAYRARFGHWDYFTPATQDLELAEPGGPLVDPRAGLRVLSTWGDWVAPPPELEGVASCALTCHVHETFLPERFTPDPKSLAAFRRMAKAHPGHPDVHRFLAAARQDRAVILGKPGSEGSAHALVAFHRRERTQLLARLRATLERGLAWMETAWSTP
jgi:hypothetical protein